MVVYSRVLTPLLVCATLLSVVASQSASAQQSRMAGKWEWYYLYKGEESISTAIIVANWDEPSGESRFERQDI